MGNPIVYDNRPDHTDLASNYLSEAVVQALEAAYKNGILPDPPPLAINGTPPATAKVGVPYNFTPTISGGIGGSFGPRPRYTLFGKLPPGLSFDPETGTISGAPLYFQNQAGVAVYPGLTLQVSDLNARYQPIPLPKFTITVSA